MFPFNLAAERCCVAFLLHQANKRQVLWRLWLHKLELFVFSVGGGSRSAESLPVQHSVFDIKLGFCPSPPTALNSKYHQAEHPFGLCQFSGDTDVPSQTENALFLFCQQEACMYLLKNYDWCLDPPSQDLEYKWLPVSRPANPPSVSFTRLGHTGRDGSDTARDAQNV